LCDGRWNVCDSQLHSRFESSKDSHAIGSNCACLRSHDTPTPCTETLPGSLNRLASLETVTQTCCTQASSSRPGHGAVNDNNVEQCRSLRYNAAHESSQDQCIHVSRHKHCPQHFTEAYICYCKGTTPSSKPMACPSHRKYTDERWIVAVARSLVCAPCYPLSFVNTRWTKLYPGKRLILSSAPRSWVKS